MKMINVSAIGSAGNATIGRGEGAQSRQESFFRVGWSHSISDKWIYMDMDKQLKSINIIVFKWSSISI